MANASETSLGGSLDELCINTMRFLSVDAVEKAKSGHPGTPMGAAPMAYVLWDRFLKHNPGDPKWPNRDRFVLSCGHASMLLYSLLYLTGYGLTLNDIKNFRQWGSKSPGHLEYGPTPGVETTTGPLGQGVGNAVGMAIAEKWLAENYNRPGFEIINHFTYAMLSDGDMEEGVSSEVASLAGALRLGKIIFLYDANDISIEGKASITLAENVPQRFRSYGWHTIGPIDGMDVADVDVAIRAAQAETNRPSLIICRTTIGYGSPNKAGTAAAHGEPLGLEEVLLTRQKVGWSYEPFTVPAEALAHFRRTRESGHRWQHEWQEKLGAYLKAYPKEARQLEEDLNGNLPEGWDSGLADLFKGQDKPIATRNASGRVMNVIANKVHSFLGGSADLAPSTKTNLKDQGDFSPADYRGRNMHFGVREHAMGSISSGMALHGGLIPYTGTFLVFYDYMRSPVRLAAMMGIRVIYIFTHDSIGLGQDGPTHQPIEQLIGLRSVPNLVTIRPADATETAEAWKIALGRRNGPTALILSRQNLPVLDRNKFAPADGVSLGGYVLWEAATIPDVILIGTGSEVHIVLEAGKRLQAQGVGTRVVSLPSWELYDSQPVGYQNSVLPPDIKKCVSVEAGSPLGWERFVGPEGVIIGISRFGASAPSEVIYEKFGLTPERVVNEALRLIGKRQ
ncbi:MAG: transketolase [Dehalococcoidales bacterium]|nr:transketolase [Dehalococcoidales bacterium]